MVKVHLDVGERITAVKMLSTYKGSVLNWKMIDEDLRKVALSKEDFVKFGVKQMDDRMSWNENTDTEIELDEVTVDYLRTTIEKKKDSDRADYFLFKKLPVKEENK